MTVKGMLRRIRRHHQGMALWVPTWGTLVLHGMNFRTERQLASYHTADGVDCPGDGQCFQVSGDETEHRRNDAGYHYVHVVSAMQMSPGSFAEILGMNHQDVLALARSLDVPEL